MLAKEKPRFRAEPFIEPAKVSESIVKTTNAMSATMSKVVWTASVKLSSWGESFSTCLEDFVT